MTEIIQMIAAGGDLATIVLAYSVFKLYQAVNLLDRRLLRLELGYGE